MNTNIVSKTETKSLPYLPVITVSKHRRVTTKHFTNLALWLSSGELAMINFLVYQVKADNTFQYSTHLLDQFSAAKNFMLEQVYKKEISYKTPISIARDHFMFLVHNGLILKTKTRSKYMLNPMLSYPVDVVSVKEYNKFQEFYQSKRADALTAHESLEIVEYFGNIVKQFLESKKKNYKYGKR